MQQKYDFKKYYYGMINMNFTGFDSNTSEDVL